jgi:hypothetical protein
MPIHAVCNNCGFIFLVEFGLDCPACIMADRAEAVAKTFKPLDSLRTALGIPGLREHPELSDVWEYHGDEIRWHGKEPDNSMSEHEAHQRETLRYLRGERLCTPNSDPAELPRDMKLPKHADAQIWELRRLFRF